MNASPSPSVLLVDPFHDEREMFREYLELVGFAVHAFGNNREALRAAVGVKPDVALLRTRPMAVRPDVLDVITAMRALAATERVPVILLTTDARDRAPALDGGCREVLVLPVLPDALAQTIRVLVKSAAA